jgi:hypothetical protein
VALGLTLTVLLLYLRMHRMDHKDGAYRIPLMGISHALLIAAIEGEVLQHVAQNDPFEWWLSPVVVISFSLSIWGLVEMLRSPRLRRLDSDVQAHVQR